MKNVVLLFMCAVLGICAQRDEYGEMVGNPDDTADIYRPCQIYDIHCIRRFFADHSHCRIANGPVPDPYVRSLTPFYLPRVNLTVHITNHIINGLNGRIVEFYINKDTDNLVLSVDFRGLTQFSNNNFFSYHRKNKEDIVTVDFATVRYSSVVVTTVIPNIKDLSLEDAESTAYVDDSAPPFALGPGLVSDSDPETQVSFAEFLADIPTDIRELFFTDAPFYISTFIQISICDFGLKVL